MNTSRGHNPSLSDLEKEAARNRADLMGTVDVLQARLSPTALREDVDEYVRDKRDGVVRSLEQRVRDNPLQSAAFAAGLAYPLLRLAGAIPVPLLLIGAGVVLTRRSRSDGKFSSAQGEGFMATARERIGDAGDKLVSNFTDASSVVQDKLQQAKSTVQKSIDRASDKLSDVSADLRDKMANVVDTSDDNPTPGAIGGSIKDTAARASDIMTSGAQAGADAAGQARDRVMQVAQQAHGSVATMVQQNPLILGGIGMVIGAAIAAALPRTHPEEKAFGNLSREARQKAEDLAADGIAAAKSAAQDLYDVAAQAAADQGLTTANLKQAAGDLESKVKKVVAAATNDEPRKTDSSIDAQSAFGDRR